MMTSANRSDTGYIDLTGEEAPSEDPIVVILDDSEDDDNQDPLQSSTPAIDQQLLSVQARALAKPHQSHKKRDQPSLSGTGKGTTSMGATPSKPSQASPVSAQPGNLPGAGPVEQAYAGVHRRASDQPVC